MLNPATMKQALVEGAVRLPQLNMHEQGNGRINLPASQAILANYTPRASLIPPAIHLADCPYMWPHCKQPLYAHALPVVLNATVVNGMANTGYFEGPPVYEGLDEGGKMLHVTFKYSDVLWPWSGYLAVYIQVSAGGWGWWYLAECKVLLAGLAMVLSLLQLLVDVFNVTSWSWINKLG
jgi:membrane-bound transcription factor site-1 protease